MRISRASEPPPAAPVPRRPGRPRSTAADDAILDAAIELVAERGLHDASTEAIAARAHAGKDTMYRRWPQKDQLMRAVLERMSSVRPRVPDTGSLRPDLEAYLAELDGRLSGSELGPILAAAVGEAPHRPGLRRLLQAHRAGVEADVTVILRRAADRGELPPDVPLGPVAVLLVAPRYAEWLLSGGSVTARCRSREIDAVLRPWRPPAA